MFNLHHVALMLITFVVVTGVGRPDQSKKEDPLEALKFLEGVWHGEGKSNYGAYEFELKNERRGRWMLGTSSIYAPGTDRILVVSTGLIGYDEKGLVMHSFDGAGAMVFRGELVEGGVRFEWKDGESYRRRMLRRLADGSISNREESYLPAVNKEKTIVESVSLPGKRQPKL